VLTREKVCRGCVPTGPRRPGGGLFGTVGGGMGEAAAESFVGSGKAEPIDAANFLTALHLKVHPFRTPYLTPDPS
jgi:hypothetical protein